MSVTLNEALEDYGRLDELTEADVPEGFVVTHENWFAPGQIRVITGLGACSFLRPVPVLGDVLLAVRLLLATGKNASLLLNQVDRAPQYASIINRLFMIRKRKIVLYDVFIDTVADGRGMTRDEVHEVAQGRVWTGAQAYQIGLVDRLGGLHEALAAVREKLDLDPKADVALVSFPAPRGLAEELASLFQMRLDPFDMGMRLFPRAFRPVQHWLGQVSFDEPLAILPVWVEMR